MAAAEADCLNDAPSMAAAAECTNGAYHTYAIWATSERSAAAPNSAGQVHEAVWEVQGFPDPVGQHNPNLTASLRPMLQYCQGSRYASLCYLRLMWHGSVRPSGQETSAGRADCLDASWAPSERAQIGCLFFSGFFAASSQLGWSQRLTQCMHSRALSTASVHSSHCGACTVCGTGWSTGFMRLGTEFAAARAQNATPFVDVRRTCLRILAPWAPASVHTEQSRLLACIDGATLPYFGISEQVRTKVVVDPLCAWA